LITKNLQSKIHTIFPGDLVKFKKRMVSSGVMGSSLSWTYPKYKGYGVVISITNKKPSDFDIVDGGWCVVYCGRNIKDWVRFSEIEVVSRLPL